MSPDNPTIGISEAARVLRVSESRVRQLIEQKKLVVFRSDKGQRVIQRDSLHRLASARLK